MATDYPEWVMKHKKKGTYVNVVKGKYYLYAAHSERVPGTDKVRRVSDGYLGRITETEGFVPAKKKLQGGVWVYEYGLSETIFRLCAKIHAGLRREFRANADFVMVSGTLLFMHGAARREFYEASWLSRRFPGADVGKRPTNKQRAGIERTARMIGDTLKRHFGEDCELAVALLPLVRKADAGNESALAKCDEGILALAARHGVDLEDEKHRQK
jgi:hypothetical protein